ncbi:ABC transporter ATP-binding protein [Paenibacillus thiaminolyticus]|uniref:ABC transporter ATP-binding protein n=1 Tax=Paenibacillus thiaminolyticus TaxID=49283 RepID=UPI002330E875|nr:ABC transporter ATP-binding protein [Paenibacillus thiaminolyticus]WCF07874.1 ABC transporter ATP-binding protein [Paenibacillus thiaminolyticus]
MNNLAISIKNLTKKYHIYDNPFDRLKEALNFSQKRYSKDFYALSDMSFDILKGETVGIIGKNGSGKSTLLKIITGVLTPSSGSVSTKGYRISSLLELGAGFNMEYTGIENIYLNGTILGYSRGEITKKIEKILDFADIGEFVYQPVKMYSSGMFARLAFAVAINVEPEILIVDEALAVGDIKFQAKCFNKFRELKEQGVTILFVSHDVYSIRHFCDRAIWLDQGQLKMIGDTITVTSEYVEFMNSGEITVSSIETGEDNLIVNEIETSEFNALNRWGSSQGAIIYANILNELNHPTTLSYVGDIFRVRVIFKVPIDISTEFLSVAFSIKSVYGVDIIVSTTYDDRNLKFTQDMCGQYIEATFEMINYLNNGEYVLNVALEDRSEMIPQYYDYIEGAQYFKSVNNKKQYGLVNIPVKQKIKLKSGGESNGY